MKIEIATITDNKLIAKNIWKMKIEAPLIVKDYRGAGQFIQILVESSWNNPLRRPMSIASVHNNEVSIIYKIFGEMTRILSKKLPGEKLDILGPLGNTFIFDDDSSVPVMVGGGVGLAPILNMHKEYLSQNNNAILIIGARNADEHFFEHDPDNDIYLSTDDGSAGIKGTVINAMEKSIDRRKNIEIFACGPEPMLKAVKQYALDKKIPTKVSVESYMGCGIGICQGCVIERFNENQSDHSYHEKYSLVCIDGPVYKSKEVNIA